MTTSAQTYAVLAMDVYNRDYTSWGGEQWLDAGSTFEVVADTSDLGSDQNGRIDEQNGFFATAYEINGEIVISFRGTDDREIEGVTSIDPETGWPLSMGLLPEQAKLAVEFYQQVRDSAAATGKSISPAHRSDRHFNRQSTKPCLPRKPGTYDHDTQERPH